MPRSPAATALLVSLGLHGAVGMWVKVRSSGVETPTEARPDVWSGHGIEIDPSAVEVPLAATPPEPERAEADTPASEATPTEQAALEPSCVNDCASVGTKQPARETEREPRVTTKKPTPARERAAAASASPPASAPAAAGSGAATPSGDAFGAVGLPPGVRHLPTAYVRAIPPGNWGVAGFRTAPTGKLCDAHVAIAVGEDRRLGDIEYPAPRERETLAPLCRTMFENARRMVASGEFSLDPKKLTTGVLRLHIEVEVSDGDAEPDHDPKGLHSESYEPVTAGRRGRASFVLNSGRRVDAWVELE